MGREVIRGRALTRVRGRRCRFGSSKAIAPSVQQLCFAPAAAWPQHLAPAHDECAERSVCCRVGFAEARPAREARAALPNSLGSRSQPSRARLPSQPSAAYR